MKTEELMIGDWVRVPSELNREKQIRSTFDMDSAVLYEAIPLTPEILEKNGFKKFDFHGIQGQHQWTWWNDTHTSVSLWCRELNDGPKDGWMIRIDSLLATCCHKIEDVHELQHALRLCHINKEITI